MAFFSRTINVTSGIRERKKTNHELGWDMGREEPDHWCIMQLACEMEYTKSIARISLCYYYDTWNVLSTFFCYWRDSVWHASSGSIDKIKARFKQKLFEWNECHGIPSQGILNKLCWREAKKANTHYSHHIKINLRWQSKDEQRISRTDCVYVGLCHYFILCIPIICIYNSFTFRFFGIIHFVFSRCIQF